MGGKPGRGLEQPVFRRSRAMMALRHGVGRVPVKTGNSVLRQRIMTSRAAGASEKGFGGRWDMRVLWKRRTGMGVFGGGGEKPANIKANGAAREDVVVHLRPKAKGR